MHLEASTPMSFDIDTDFDEQTDTDSTLAHAELELFFDELWISEVLYELKSGKEATAYCCAGGPTSGRDLVAAKVYRPLHERGFRNDAVYQSGRLDGASRRDRLAFQKKSRHGQEIQFAAWVEHEFRTLEALVVAGADVPRPIAKSTDVILMDFIGDEDGPAPLLQSVRLRRDEAERLFLQLLHNIEIFLRCRRVHGDLSPYNILYWQERLVIIDVPQSVDPDINPQAYVLLERDIANVCAHFRRFGIHADPGRIAGDLWMRYRFGEL
jgi:RIO kinase 1